MTTFTQSTAQALYVLAESVNPTLPYSIGFWVNDGSIADSQTLSLEETWTIKNGVYLFIKAVPEGNDAIDPSVLSDRIGEFLITPSVRNTRFLWIDNPEELVSRWRFHALTLSPTDTVERLTFFNFRNYELAIASGVICQLNATKDGFLFALDPSLHNLPSTGTESPETELPKTDPFYLSTGYGAHQLKGIEVNQAGEAMALPFSGELAGCLTFALTLQNQSPGTASFEELVYLDVTLRMFFKSANSLLDATDPLSGFAGLNSDQEFLISSHRYPFLGEDSDAASHYSKQGDGSQNLTLYSALDPLQPLNSDRTYFAFVEPGNSNISDLSLPSCYRTNLGYSIHVTPHGHGDSRLIFAERPGQNSSIFGSPLYLVPQGKYTLSVPNYESTPIPSGKDFSIRDEDNFLCGLAGIEYIQLSSQQVNILHLEAGKPTFAPDFVPEQIVETNEAGQRLESETTTAWGYIEYDQVTNLPVYFSQPKQSLLYRASTFQDGNQDPTDDPLTFLEVPVTGLPRGEYLPLFPYGGVSGTLAHYQQMEEQILNPQRRKQIRIVAETDTTQLTGEPQGILGIGIGTSTPQAFSALSRSATPDAQAMTAAAATSSTTETITGTTSLGLLATYSSDYQTLNSLLLAKDTDNEDVSLQDLERGSSLRSAFQSSQMFLVITDPSSLKTFDTNEPPQVIKEHFQNNQLTIQGWTFDLNPDNWRQGTGDTDTVLLFKFLDKPLIDILKDTALWEQPEVFVGTATDADERVKEIKAVRDRLVAFFENAIATANDPNAAEKDRDNAAPLARVGSSTFWSGMIALNVKLPAGTGLPQDLKALECGIQDQDNFYAQYVGSNGTPILPQNGELVAEQSSLFGLLDYQDNSVPETGPLGYAFQVANLRVQFQNSQITAFSSEVNLTLDKLFDEATQLLNSRSGRNIVILQGFTEEHDGVITYSFSFTGENYFALPDSHILNNVDIVKATFSTDPPGNDTTLTIGRFTLWGRLNFRDLETFDGLSFGSDTSLSDEVLTASNLVNRSARALEDDYQVGIDTLNQASAELQQKLDELANNEQFLQFSKLSIVMNCKHTNATQDITFIVDPSQIAFDFARSKARPHSLYSKFPLKLTNFVYLDPAQPDSKPKGYLTVKTPLGSGSMPDSGFGFNFEFNLGSLGALSGSAQFVVNLLIIWEPNQDGSQEKATTFVGLRLPGIGGDVLGFPLQSVLKLSFKTVELLVDSTNASGTAYLLKIKKVALKFFVLSFPPNGQTEIVIFGNPDATDSNDAVGWYAAYAK
ncbi:hypothetical protein [Moorena producens]|uniref:hypothetical protein n=1 Tax=Moorena producens TaxID=1155739 RepID=UPI003C75BAD0